MQCRLAETWFGLRRRYEKPGARSIQNFQIVVSNRIRENKAGQEIYSTRYRWIGFLLYGSSQVHSTTGPPHQRNQYSPTFRKREPYCTPPFKSSEIDLFQRSTQFLILVRPFILFHGYIKNGAPETPDQVFLYRVFSRTRAVYTNLCKSSNPVV